MGQTAQSLTCSIMEKQHTGLDECLRILLLYFRARNSARILSPSGCGGEFTQPLPPTLWYIRGGVELRKVSGGLPGH